MARGRRTAGIMTLGVAAVAPLLLGNTASGGFEDRVLAAQNRERAALGVPPLSWDGTLARDARGWANRLAATGDLAHAPVDPHAPQGENLWAGTRGRFSIEAMVSGWAEEKRLFKPGAFPDNSRTGRWQDVGHYTQLIWRDTRRVGCAVARGAREDVLVCRYARAGNWVGERPY